MSTKVAKTVGNHKVNITDINKNDVFSEISHYRYVGYNARGYEFMHIESGNPVFLTTVYVENLLSTADQYTDQVEVGMEDKLWTAKQIAETIFTGDVPRIGDVRQKGIRTLFQEIYNSEVFGCCFQKQGKKLTKMELADLKTKQITNATALIDNAQKSKKSMAIAYANALQLVQDNPISEYAIGEMRDLRGYKMEFVSRDGKYNCMDMDINEARPVNINTLQWLVYKGTKYIVK